MSCDLDQAILPTVQSYLAWPSLGDPGTYNGMEIVSTLVIISWSSEFFWYLDCLYKTLLQELWYGRHLCVIANEQDMRNIHSSQDCRNLNSCIQDARTLSKSYACPYRLTRLTREDPSTNQPYVTGTKLAWTIQGSKLPRSRIIAHMIIVSFSEIKVNQEDLQVSLLSGRGSLH